MLLKSKVILITCLLILVSTMLFVVAAQKYEGQEVDLLLITEPDSYVVGDRELLADFNKETGIRVKTEFLWHERLWDRIRIEALAKTSGFTAMRMSPGFIMEYYQIGALEPLDDYIKMFGYENQLDDWPESVQKSHMSIPGSDKIWSIPINANTPILIYQKKLFESEKEKEAFKEEYGYELKPPANTDQLLDMAEFFTRPSENLYGFHELLAPVAHSYVAALEYIWSFGGEVLDEDNKVILNSEETVKAMEYASKLHQYIPKEAFAADYAEEERWISNNNVAMARVWAGNARSYLNPKENPRNFQNYGMILKPKVGGTEFEAGQGVLGGGGVSLYAHAPQKEKEAAAKFLLDWLFDQDKLGEYLAAGAFHPRKSTFTHPKILEDPLMKDLGPLWLEALNKTGHARPFVPEASQIYEELSLMLHAVSLEGVDPEKAVEQATEKIYDIMDNAGYYD